MEELQEKAAAKVELEERDKQESAKLYAPNGKAEQFITMLGADKNFVNLFIGANAVGKTAVGANIVVNICYGPQNQYFEHPLFQKFPYIKKGRIISDPTTLKEKIIPELKKWLPYNDAQMIPDAPYETAKEGKNYVSKFRTNTGWEIDLMSNEQDDKEFESVDLGFVWVDEPMPKSKFMATLARGRMGMILFWTLTPLNYSAWIKNWMDEQLEEENQLDYIEAEMEDNCKVHGVRGILEHANIKRLAASYPEDEKEARVFGKFGHLIGRVHKLFRRKIHVIKPFPLNQKDFATFKALDPHTRVPDHVLYASVDRNNTIFITGEIISEGLVKELHARMIAYEEAMKFRIEGRIIDPSAFNDDQHKKEKSVGSALFDLGETYTLGSKDMMAGIKRTNDALNYEEKQGKLVRSPEMYIFDTCQVTIKQLEEYVWQEWKGPSKDDKQPSGRPKDINDHQVENLHRLLLSEPVYISYQLREGASRVGPSYAEEEENLDPYN